ncbi:MAG: PfkB family carbohydrate kinase, partial [Burkholderiales bacterium]
MDRPGVVIVGSHVQGLFMRVERFPTADETVLGWDYREALDGGKGSHQAIACGRLGLPTSFVGRVGKDRLGDRGAEWMAEAGVDLTFLGRSETTATGCGFVMINRDGVPAITTAMGANEEFSPADVDRAEPVLSRARIVLVTFEIPVATALHAARRAKELGAFTILTPGPAEPLGRDALKGLDLLVHHLPRPCRIGCRQDRYEVVLGLIPALGAGLTSAGQPPPAFQSAGWILEAFGQDGDGAKEGGIARPGRQQFVVQIQRRATSFRIAGVLPHRHGGLRHGRVITQRSSRRGDLQRVRIILEFVQHATAVFHHQLLSHILFLHGG